MSDLRQSYLSEVSALNTLRHFEDTEKLYRADLALPNVKPENRETMYSVIAEGSWNSFQLRFTAGESPAQLASSLTAVVEAYEDYVAAGLEVADADYFPAFPMTEVIDVYVDYLHLLCMAVLLRREDLIPRIHALIAETAFDETDSVLEDLLAFYLPDRPQPDEVFWDKPYGKLLDAIDSETPEQRALLMKKYVSKWYSSMKGQAHFWGAHEKIAPNFTPYFGYWAMCAGAFSYLYAIDDSEYRGEMVYPKDLVDYARSSPRSALTDGS